MARRIAVLPPERRRVLIRQGAPDGLRPPETGRPLYHIIAGCMVDMLSGVSLPAVAWAQERPYDFWWGMHPMWGMWGAWGIGMMLMMLMFWALIMVGLVVSIRWLVNQGRQSRSDTALDILRQRYARGEIEKDEFEARKRDLS